MASKFRQEHLAIKHLAIKSQFSKIPVHPSVLEPERIFIIFLHVSRDFQHLSLICPLPFRH